MAQSTKLSDGKEIAKATQIAFELEQRIAKRIHELAAQNGLTPSSQIRKIIGLSYAPPKRPRLTISLSQENYKELGKRYDIDPQDTIGIKREIMNQLIEYFDDEKDT